MNEVIFLICLALIWIVFASIQDLRKREVANWLNFSLIIFALGYRFFYSLFRGDLDFLIQGLFGLGVFFVLGNLFYYGKMFAGGDAKLMVALGPILPFSGKFLINIQIFVLFLIIFLFVGGIYGLLISVFLCIKNFKNFKKEFLKRFRRNKKKILILTIFALCFLFLGFYNYVFFGFGILIFFLPYFYLYAKAVDESCMVKKIKSLDLTEGDWIYEKIKLGKKVILPKWEGVSKNEMKLIKSRLMFVKIRQGIPFIPVFLFSFLILIYVYFFRNSFLFGVL